MNQYLIAYNNTQGFDSNKIHEAITTIPTVTDWWHYLPGLYIISTNSNAKYLADCIIQHFQGLLFLVVRLDMKDCNGVLNKDAWDWMRKKGNQYARFKIVSNALSQLPQPLSGYLSSTTRQKSLLEEVFRKRAGKY